MYAGYTELSRDDVVPTKMPTASDRFDARVAVWRVCPPPLSRSAAAYFRR